MPKKHVFISYSRENRLEVERLRNDLIDAGESVWWDQEILPGQDWKHEIRQAMNNSYAVIVCLSGETERRNSSGIYPEIRDAIEIYRNLKPGSVYLIVVRLSECEIPLLEIDATRTLKNLQYVDLFPEKQRSRTVQRILAALQEAPDHP